MRDRELEAMVIAAMGGEDAVRQIAELGDLPKKLQPDVLRDLARYLLRSSEAGSERTEPAPADTATPAKDA